MDYQITSKCDHFMSYLDLSSLGFPIDILNNIFWNIFQLKYDCSRMDDKTFIFNDKFELDIFTKLIFIRNNINNSFSHIKIISKVEIIVVDIDLREPVFAKYLNFHRNKILIIIPTNQLLDGYSGKIFLEWCKTFIYEITFILIGNQEILSREELQFKSKRITI